MTGGDLLLSLLGPTPVSHQKNHHSSLIHAATAFLNSYTDDEAFLENWAPSHLHNLVLAAGPSHSFPSHDRLLLLNAIKVLAKHNKLNSFLYASEDFGVIATLAGLSQKSNTGPDENDMSANEARKIIANLLLLDPQHGVHIFISEQSLPPLLELSRSTTTSLQSIFLIYRILFLVTASPDDHISAIIAFGLDHYIHLLSRVINTPPESPQFTSATVLSEILKTMFNLQSRSGAEFDKPTDIFPTRVMCTVVSVVQSAPSKRMTSPISDAIHVLMCGPSGSWCTEQLIHIFCSEILLHECMDVLFPITPSGLDINRDRIVPLLYLLAQLYATEQSSTLAKLIKSLLVPQDLDRKIPMDQGRSLGHYVIRLLTYPESSAVRLATETLIFALFDKNPSDMVAHTGLGPSAGFLANHGLLNEEAFRPSAAVDPDINPITGQAEPAPGPAGWNDMSEEEKEHEAEDLFAKFDRLNELGIIKVVDPRQANGGSR